MREVEQEFRFGHADIEMPVKYPTRDVQRAVRVRQIASLHHEGQDQEMKTRKQKLP